MKKDFALIFDKIKEASSIVVLVHENPDGDAIGSAIALIKTIEKMGKKPECYIESIPCNCEFLFDKDNPIKPFDGMDVNKEFELCIALDCGSEERLGKAKELFEKAKFTICMDHHLTNSEYARINYIDSKAAATGEIIFDFITETENVIDKEIATAMYSAVVSDTGMFKHKNTTENTFKIASELMKYGIDITEITRKMFYESTANRTIFLGRILEGLELYSDNRICVLTAKVKDLEKYNIDESELDGMVEFARNIKGVEVGILMKPHGNLFKASLRSNGKIDVAEIAQVFDGGGHKFAAGCRFDGVTCEMAKKMLVCELEKVLG